MAVGLRPATISSPARRRSVLHERGMSEHGPDPRVWHPKVGQNVPQVRIIHGRGESEGRSGRGEAVSGRAAVRRGPGDIIAG
jgi:hypothetical protein